MFTFRRWFSFLVFAGLAAAAFLMLSSIQSVNAGSRTVNSVTLEWPDSYESCTPISDVVSLSNLPTGSTVLLSISQVHLVGSDPVHTPFESATLTEANGTVSLTIVYPPVSEWEVDANGVATITFAAEALVRDSNGDKYASIGGGKWTVTCVEAPPETVTPEPTATKEPPPDATKEPTATSTTTPTNTPIPTPTFTPTPQVGGQGCTPGFWRQPHHFDSWTVYGPGDDFESIFGVNASFNPHTLFDAVTRNGGGENAMARHAVAALLNAASGEVSYLYSTSNVITMVQNAYASSNFEATKNLFEAQNESFCPLD